MADLIDRQKLYEAFEKIDWWSANSKGKLTSGSPNENAAFIAYKDALKAIDDAPPASPKKGEWIKYTVDIAERPYHCSECGWSDHHINRNRVRNFNHCPDCGADMRGKSE